MPSMEIVDIVVGGIPYTGWKSMAVSMNARSPERLFQIVGALANPPILAAALAIQPDDMCMVRSNGDVLVIGKVHDVEIELDAGNHEIRISGKSKGAETVKSSVDHDTHEWKDKDPHQIAQDIDKQGIGYSTDEVLEKIPKVRANIGDTHMKLLNKLTEKQRLFLTGADDGGVMITRHGKYRHAGGIIEGDNFMRGTAKRSVADRPEKVKVKGHRHKGHGKQNFRYEEQATDPGGRKGAVKVIVPRADMTKKEAKDLAEHAVDNRFGDSVTLQCELQGFRDQGGLLWKVGWLVWCEVPSCQLEEDLAINELTFHQDDKAGSTVKMVLVHPAALGGKTGGKSTKFNSKGSGSWRNRLENK